MFSRIRRLRDRRRIAALAGVASCGAAGLIAATAVGSQAPTGTPPVTIREGRHIVVVHNIDLVGAFGYGAGERLKLEVLRGPSRIPIARVDAPAYDVEGEFGVEVNHGPEGPVRAGDCFDDVTPDIRPFDLVRVTDGAGGVDQAFIDNITIDDIAAVGSDVVVTGAAQYASDGSAIPLERLDSGFWRGPDEAGADRRGDTPAVTLLPGGRYEARYTATNEYGTFRKPAGAGPTTQDTVLTAGHEFGYGHAEAIDPVTGQPLPLPAEVQLVDVGRDAAGTVQSEANGPVLGCPGRASTASDLTVVDDKAVSRSSGNLEVSGPVAADTAVTATLDDGAGAGAPVTAPVTVDGGAWKAEFTAAQMAGLADGTLTITASFGGATPAEVSRQITKDSTVPVAPAPPPGPTAASPAASASTQPGVVAPIKPVASLVSGAVARRRAPALARISARSRISMRSIRASGLRVAFAMPSGARAARVALYRGTRRIEQRTLTGGGRKVVRFKRLRPGRYVIEVKVGATLRTLGPSRTKRVTITR
jgi:hypothetical protein